MKNLIDLVMLALITSLIQSCSNLPSSQDPSSCTPEKIEIKNSQKPEIPFHSDNAFYPLRKNPEGKILPSYMWQECAKRFIVCLEWKYKVMYFEDLEWFYAGEFGLAKRPKR